MPNRDALLFVGYALVNAGLAVATAHGYVSTTDAAEVSAVLTAAATAYHIPNAKASAALKQAKDPAPAAYQPVDHFDIPPAGESV